MSLIVCSLSHVDAVIAARRPSHLVTLLDPANLIETPSGIAPDRHLKLGVNDIVEEIEGRRCADEALVSRIVAFAAGWDRAAPMLVHCWAGISRSTATAFVVACERNPGTPEAEIAEALRRASVHAHPNRKIVALADRLLGRQGRMIAAVEAIGPGEIVERAQPFDLPARYR